MRTTSFASRRSSAPAEAYIYIYISAKVNILARVVTAHDSGGAPTVFVSGASAAHSDSNDHERIRLQHPHLQE